MTALEIALAGYLALTLRLRGLDLGATYSVREINCGERRQFLSLRA